MILDAQALWVDYQRERSVHKVASLHGCTGETVRAHLRKAGHRLVRHPPGSLENVAWSSAEIKTLRRWYATHPTSKGFSLGALAANLGRLKSNISRKARELGLTSLTRPKLLPEERQPAEVKKYATDEERNKATSSRIKKYIKENGHPRGATGMTHSLKTRRAISASSKRMWADPTSTHNQPEFRQQLSDRIQQRIKDGNPLAGTHPYSRTKSGKRADLENRFFRSSWEANYARYLNFQVGRLEIKEWDYECKTFWFETIKRGVRSYTPDFKIVLNDGTHEWHEVKGWMDDKSKTRLKRMAKYYPEEKLLVIDGAWFKQAKRGGLSAILPNWE